MTADFSRLTAQWLDKAMPLPSALTLLLVVSMAERPWLAGPLAFVFLGANFAIARSAAKGRVLAREGLVRVALAFVFLPLIIVAAGSQFPSWIAAIPPLFALSFYRSASKTPLTGSMPLVAMCVLAVHLTATSSIESVIAAITLISVSVLVHPMMTALRQRNDELGITLVELRAAKDTAERARIEAEQSSLAKAQFLANMSHEIRTPMNAVIGMTGLLLDTKLDDEQREFVSTVRSSGDALLAIINDILDFSKIDANQVALENVAFDLRSCLESALELVAEKAAGRRLELVCAIDDTVPETLLGDITRLRQIVTNLLDNAIKFTERGEVVLAATLEAPDAEPSDACVVRLSVLDTGIGIPAERMDRLFQSFSQVDASTTRKYGGTGLGLVISKRLVELMGGTLEVESEVGRGTKFSFTLRAKRGPSRRPPYLERKQPELEGKRLLVVDDNATNREILRRQALSWSMTVQLAASGEEALAWVRSGPAFDIAIIDMHMPEMDGLTLAEQLRELDGALPLLMLTSVGWRPSSERLSLFAAYLTKPIKAAALYDRLVKTLAAGPDTVPTNSVPIPLPDVAARLPFKILVAEDNITNQKVAIAMLQRLGYRPDVVANGLEAVQALRRQAYDIVLMDIQMPELNGLEATERIRSGFAADRQPRIIAITANATVQDRAACLSAGADDYVAKPFRAEELVAAFQRIHAGAAHGSASSGARSLAVDLDVLAELRTMVQEQSHFEDLVRTFLDETPTLLHEASRALDDARPADAGRFAHQVISTASTFGAKPLAELARRMELVARNRDADGARAMLEQMQHEFAIVQATLSASIAAP